MCGKLCEVLTVVTPRVDWKIVEVRELELEVWVVEFVTLALERKTCIHSLKGLYYNFLLRSFASFQRRQLKKRLKLTKFRVFRETREIQGFSY